MPSPTKGSFSALGRSSRSLMMWRTFASLCLVLILLVEWKRFNAVNPSSSAMHHHSEFFHSDQRHSHPVQVQPMDESLDFYGGAGARQLLKKLSNAASTTTIAGSALEDMQNDMTWPEDEDFGQAVSLAHWLDKRGVVYESRQKRIEAMCAKYNVSTISSNDTVEDLINFSVHNDSASGRYVERIKSTQFLLSRANRVMLCPLNKVASSSMMRLMLTLQGIDHKNIESPHGYRKRFNPQDSKDLEFSRDHFYKFMLVRHPMERLVSCYFDKMVNGTHKSLKGFRRLVKTTARAIRERRRVKSNENGNRRPLGSYPNSNPFLGFKNSKKRLARNASSSEMEQKGGVIPTLDDFLEYILTDLSGEGFSSHWVPYWRMCTPCHFKYDMILKLESGFDDFTYLWKKTGLDGKAPIPWAHQGLSQDSEAKHLARMKSFYSKVPRDTLLRIYQAYKLDYELFDYDFNQVLLLAGYDPI